MNYKEIQDIAYNMIDEVDLDDQIAVIVQSAINKAYLDLCVKDKRITITYVPIIRGVATLPDDIISVERITPNLSTDDKRVGNNIITDKTGTFSLVYSYIREPLINDTDEPDLHLSLQYALATYACYKYFEYRKKTDVASTFLTNYNIEVMNFENAYQEGSVETIGYVER